VRRARPPGGPPPDLPPTRPPAATTIITPCQLAWPRGPVGARCRT
jgi:hypothetical protein